MISWSSIPKNFKISKRVLTMQVNVAKAQFESEDGLLKLVVEGEVIPDFASQADLLEYVFKNGTLHSGVGPSDAPENPYDHPAFHLEVSIEEAEWQAELQRRKDAAEGKNQPQAQPQAQPQQQGPPPADPKQEDQKAA